MCDVWFVLVLGFRCGGLVLYAGRKFSNAVFGQVVKATVATARAWVDDSHVSE